MIENICPKLDFSLKGSVVEPDFLARTLEAVARSEFVESHD